VTFFIAAVGAAFQDAQANSFVATVKSAHRWLGVIHASYGAGCVVGALVAAAISSPRPEEWALFYGFAIGIAGLNMGLVTWAFWDDAKFRKGAAEEDGEGSIGKAWAEMRETVAQKEVWLLSLFYFFYLGLGITLGGMFTAV
jgi:fucose permease